MDILTIAGPKHVHGASEVHTSPGWYHFTDAAGKHCGSFVKEAIPEGNRSTLDLVANSALYRKLFGGISGR